MREMIERSRGADGEMRRDPRSDLRPVVIGCRRRLRPAEPEGMGPEGRCCAKRDRERETKEPSTASSRLQRASAHDVLRLGPGHLACGDVVRFFENVKE